MSYIFFAVFPMPYLGCIKYRTQHMPWADGTPCGEGLWCMRSECVPVGDRDEEPVDGTWGQWNRCHSILQSSSGGIFEFYRIFETRRGSMLTSYAPMINTAPCIMFWLPAYIHYQGIMHRAV